MPHFLKTAFIAALTAAGLSAPARSATSYDGYYKQYVQFSMSIFIEDRSGNRSGYAFSYDEDFSVLRTPPEETGGNGIFDGYANLFISRDGFYPFEPVRPVVRVGAVVDQSPDRFIPFTRELGLYDLEPLTFTENIVVQNLFGNGRSTFRFESDNTVRCLGRCELALRNRLTGEIIASDLFLTSGRYTLSPIPVPASGAMLAGAMGLFAFFRRRRPA